MPMQYCLVAWQIGGHLSENHFDLVLEELTERAIGKLLEADIFDASAFEIFKDHLWRKAEDLQYESCISRQILRSIRSAAGAIRSRSEYLPAVREQIHWADDFEEMLDRLIAGETRSDRRPGIPRII
jgi:hypothetical protein